MTPNLRIQVGGILQSEGSVYIKRPEDRQFLDSVTQRKSWTNVYGCRTMGKSSLYTKYFSTLKGQGIRPLAVDIAAQIGDNPLTGREWAQALGEAFAAELGVESHYLTQPLVSLPLNAPTALVFERLFVDGLLGQYKKPLLLILDEYDYISKLDYCEEILSALRYLQTLQTRSNDLNGLSVCLVGLRPITKLALPAFDNTSPIAVPIELVDFEYNSVTINSLMGAFANDARPPETVLRRVLELSGGQPLVTMDLLQGVRSRASRTRTAVDSLAKALVADSGLGNDMQLFAAIERAFVAEGGNAFAALRAYESLLQGSNEVHTAPEADLLLLFGLVRRRKSRLEVKGELFRRRFDLAWAERMLSVTASEMQQYRGGVTSNWRGRKICVINTGGTIGMVQRGKKVVPPRDADEFKSYFTSLDSIAQVVDFINLLNPPRDSINVFPHQWSTIARYIYNRRNDGFDGFVVAHGTDTMAYTASAVAFALGPQLRFPVVFTGAQTTPDVAYGDAHVNLYRACEVAKKDIPEVVICFGNFVYRAVRAQKKDDRRFDGFESPTYPPLAEITGEINVRRELLRPLPRKKEIELKAEFEESILIVPQFPGLEPSFFDHLLSGDNDNERCHGIIIQTLGAGNVASEAPYSFIPFVRRAFEQGIPVIVTSQYPPDPGTHTKYTPAQAPIKAGAIHAGNMTQAAAVAKFRWVLASARRRRDWKRMSPDKKKELVSELMVGKPTVGEF